MGSLVIPYGSIQQAFNEDPDAFHNAVDSAANTAANGDPGTRARLIAEWHSAVAALESAHQGDTTLSTPQNGLASRLQTLIADRATGAGKTETVVAAAQVTTAAGDSTADNVVDTLTHVARNGLTLGLGYSYHRKEVTIEVLNMQGATVMSFVLHRAWASEFQALPEMDANANAVAIQTLKLEHEGWTFISTEPTES